MDSLVSSTIYALLIAFVINVILCPIIIPLLTKFKYGQNPRDDGPQAHIIKTGTPTMGGIMIIISFVLASLFFLNENSEGLIIIFVTLGYGLIGFLDDYIKVSKKSSQGLRAYQKLILQVIVTGIFLGYLLSKGSYFDIIIPFTDNSIKFNTYLFIPFIFFTVVGTVNGANLTDGLDGLASGVTILIVTFFVFIAISLESQISPIGGAVIGSLLGFLLFNAYPANVFMGDTGSLALGGFVAATAIILQMPLFIIIVGFIYLLESLSVMLQVSYFKITKGKRIFKMAPIHHHFEESGWPETKIVVLFYISTALLCLIGFLAV